MDPLTEQRPFKAGDQVIASDDDSLGTVESVGPTHLVIEKGLLRKEHFYVPFEAANSYADGVVYLTVTKDQILDQGWDSPPLLETEADGRPLNLPMQN